VLEKLYKANVIAASVYGLISVFVCSTYELWHPHPVGHLAPAASGIVTGVWALHCWQLGVSRSLASKAALLGAAVPLILSVVALAACWLRYRQQYAA